MSDVVNAYQSLIVRGELRPDATQMAALPALQAFADDVVARGAVKPGFWQRLRGWTPPAPRGLYLYGPVGRGKSMLMDLLFDCLPEGGKRRVHFHQFMLEVQARLFRLQSDQSGEVLARVAGEIAAESPVLCFDEFHVGNIADAMILGRLFEALFARGVTVVATSNWPPDELYKNGLQRDRFLPFIDLIKARMQVYAMGGGTDHRYEQTQTLPGVFHPLSADNTRKLNEIFAQLTHYATPTALDLPVQGRVLHLAKTAKGVGLFQAEELTKAALGSADFLALADCLHTVLIDGVPVFGEGTRNETTRFINLIDALYEAKVKLYLVAAAAPEALCPKGDLAFPFQRTISRLTEMQGEEYRAKPHLGA